MGIGKSVANAWIFNIMTSLDSRLTIAAGWLTALAPFFMLFGPAVLEIAIALISLLFLAHCYLCGNWRWVREGWVVLLLALCGYTSVRGLFTDDPVDSFQRSLLWGRYVLFAAALSFWTLRIPIVQKRLLMVLLASLAFLGADTLLQYISGTDLFGRALIRGGEQVRLTGPFSNPRVGIILAWTLFPALCALLGYGWRTRNGWLGFGLMLLAAAAIFLSGERMAFLLFGLGLAVTFLFVKQARILLLGSGVAGALAIAVLVMHNPALKERQVSESSQAISGFWGTSYGQLWFSSLKIVEHHPLFGVGSKQFRSKCASPLYGPTSAEALWLRCKLHPHNLYMEWLSEAGLIGFALFLAAAVHWLYACYEARRTVLSTPLLAGLVIALLLRLWPLSATTSQFAPWSAGPFWLLLGWLLAVLSLAREEAQGSR